MITGSRDVDRQTARTTFELHLAPFLSHGHRWILGGGRGVEQWALEWLLEQNEVCWIVVPYTSARQAKWLQPWFDLIDKVVELQLPKRKTAYATRNRHIVDLAGIVFGFWSGSGAGTIKTLKHAMRQRKEVHAIPV